MFRFRPAKPTDASDLAALCDIAGRGTNAWVWRAAVEHGDAVSVFEAGRMRIQMPDHDLSFQNATIGQHGQAVAGALFGNYREPDYTPHPAAPDDPLSPLYALHAATGGTWYLGVIAIFAEYRGRGYAKALLSHAIQKARRSGAPAITLTAVDENEAALGLYYGNGFQLVDSRPFEPVEGCPDKGNWLLLRRELAG